MKVYHGSYIKINTIDLSKCEPNKDFGQGFYVTKIYEQALTWANRKGRYNHTEGVITELSDLTHENTHQICFCTQKSLLMLEQTDFSGITAIERISENVLENLIADNEFSEIMATDLFYNSALYAKLSNPETEFYKKCWQEIYEMLKTELKF